METFLKIAEDDNLLAEEILKVASEAAEEIPEEDQLEDFLNELEESGVDLDDPDTVAELEELLSNGALEDFTVEKTAEILAEDILKVASGMNEGFETAAASKAVQNYFNLDGAANLGSMFGRGPVGVGSAITPAAEANIGGGFGRLIGGGNLMPYAVNAGGKVSGVLGQVYKDNIRIASEDPEQFFLDTVEAAANAEGQTPEEFLQDLGFEYLQELAKEELLEN